MSIVASLLSAALALVSADPTSTPTKPQVEVVTFDCGQLHFTDLGPFSDTGEYDGRPGVLQASCFLIRHPNGNLLWEAGLGDEVAEAPAGVQRANYRAVVRHTLKVQLADLGLRYDDIDFFAFSHGHADHLGNANRLKSAIWLVNTRELQWINGTPTPGRVDPRLIAARPTGQTRLIDGDYDVFGDGSVRILFAPGHTPGHQVLLVRPAHGGPLLISGDLFHTHANRRHRRLPVFNVSRADTLASMDRIETIVRETGAKVIIEHAAEDIGPRLHARVSVHRSRARLATGSLP
ncbi:N-acyl homoserine lactonase family protein [Sphingomonas sp. So64.6b]|uniref:N-acyl homoserine lactonase family protein n=1 Tax=Sphingomonas sp. So64.6b TaxID=2997354 RepID=UPI0015FF5394|nr:N-acyl homoserine lactonase family protein [Sphingomonas sp. So64.6b]QNA84691.1 N-acyl homoserine lactonase family protein [Sphingomonas sp. So64.6b]